VGALDGVAGLLLDAGGTLLRPRKPVETIYARIGAEYGVTDVDFRGAFPGLRRRPGEPRLRMVGDGRRFWRAVVKRATGCADPDYFERLYTHYADPAAYELLPGVPGMLDRVAARGIRRCVVSNWDDRLPAILAALGITERVDAVVCSGLLDWEKPDPRIFQRACRLMGCHPARALHIGDDPRCDVQGARAAGCRALLWPRDVTDWTTWPG